MIVRIEWSGWKQWTTFWGKFPNLYTDKQLWSNFFAGVAMLAKKFAQDQTKTLYKQNLSAIEYTVDYSTGTGKLSNKAQRLLWFLLACLRLGYTELRVPIGALRDAVARNTRYSERTLYRALRELEDNAIIWRRKLRIDYNHNLSVIRINKAAFAYWLRKSSNNIIPAPTCTHTHTQLPKGQNDNLTRIDASNFVDTYLRSRPRARETISNGSIFKKRPDLPALLFSIAAIFWPKRFWPARQNPTEYPNARQMFSVAESEYHHPGSTDCPVDFKFWTSRWTEMSKERREITATTEIIPYLQNSRITKKIQKKNPKKSKKTVKKKNAAPIYCTASEVANFVSQLKLDGAGSADKNNSRASPGDVADSTTSLSADDLAILQEAKLKAGKKADYS